MMLLFGMRLKLLFLLHDVSARVGLHGLSHWLENRLKGLVQAAVGIEVRKIYDSLERRYKEAEEVFERENKKSLDTLDSRVADIFTKLPTDDHGEQMGGIIYDGAGHRGPSLSDRYYGLLLDKEFDYADDISLKYFEDRIRNAVRLDEEPQSEQSDQASITGLRDAGRMAISDLSRARQANLDTRAGAEKEVLRIFEAARIALQGVEEQQPGDAASSSRSDGAEDSNASVKVSQDWAPNDAELRKLISRITSLPPGRGRDAARQALSEGLRPKELPTVAIAASPTMTDVIVRLDATLERKFREEDRIPQIQRRDLEEQEKSFLKKLGTKRDGRGGIEWMSLENEDRRKVYRDAVIRGGYSIVIDRNCHRRFRLAGEHEENPLYPFRAWFRSAAGKAINLRQKAVRSKELSPSTISRKAPIYRFFNAFGRSSTRSVNNDRPYRDKKLPTTSEYYLDWAPIPASAARRTSPSETILFDRNRGTKEAYENFYIKLQMHNREDEALNDGSVLRSDRDRQFLARRLKDDFISAGIPDYTWTALKSWLDTHGRSLTLSVDKSGFIMVRVQHNDRTDARDEEREARICIVMVMAHLAKIAFTGEQNQPGMLEVSQYTNEDGREDGREELFLVPTTYIPPMQIEVPQDIKESESINIQDGSKNCKELLGHKRLWKLRVAKRGGGEHASQNAVVALATRYATQIDRHLPLIGQDAASRAAQEAESKTKWLEMPRASKILRSLLRHSAWSSVALGSVFILGLFIPTFLRMFSWPGVPIHLSLAGAAIICLTFSLFCVLRIVSAWGLHGIVAFDSGNKPTCVHSLAICMARCIFFFPFCLWIAPIVMAIIIFFAYLCNDWGAESELAKFMQPVIATDSFVSYAKSLRAILWVLPAIGIGLLVQAGAIRNSVGSEYEESETELTLLDRLQELEIAGKAYLTQVKSQIDAQTPPDPEVSILAQMPSFDSVEPAVRRARRRVQSAIDTRKSQFVQRSTIAGGVTALLLGAAPFRAFDPERVGGIEDADATKFAVASWLTVLKTAKETAAPDTASGETTFVGWSLKSDGRLAEQASSPEAAEFIQYMGVAINDATPICKLRDELHKAFIDNKSPHKLFGTAATVFDTRKEQNTVLLALEDACDDEKSTTKTKTTSPSEPAFTVVAPSFDLTFAPVFTRFDLSFTPQVSVSMPIRPEETTPVEDMDFETPTIEGCDKHAAVYFDWGRRTLEGAICVRENGTEDFSNACSTPQTAENVRTQLELIAQNLARERAETNTQIRVHGYTDNSGPLRVNLDISRARAEAVMAVLGTGIGASHGMGELYRSHPARFRQANEPRARVAQIYSCGGSPSLDSTTTVIR